MNNNRIFKGMSTSRMNIFTGEILDMFNTRSNVNSYEFAEFIISINELASINESLYIYRDDDGYYEHLTYNQALSLIKNDISKTTHRLKTFAQLNRIATITLTCYDSVVDFYTRNGFRTQAERIVRNDSDSEDSDSDSESDSESGSSNSKHSIIYDMSYAVSFGGKRKKNRSKKHISKKHRSKHISKKTRSNNRKRII